MSEVREFEYYESSNSTFFSSDYIQPNSSRNQSSQKSFAATSPLPPQQIDANGGKRMTRISSQRYQQFLSNIQEECDAEETPDETYVLDRMNYNLFISFAAKINIEKQARGEHQFILTDKDRDRFLHGFRRFLYDEQFDALMDSIKRLDADEQTLEETLKEMEEIFSTDHIDMFLFFQYKLNIGQKSDLLPRFRRWPDEPQLKSRWPDGLQKESRGPADLQLRSRGPADLQLKSRGPADLQLKFREPDDLQQKSRE